MLWQRRGRGRGQLNKVTAAALRREGGEREDTRDLLELPVRSEGRRFPLRPMSQTVPSGPHWGPLRLSADDHRGAPCPPSTVRRAALSKGQLPEGASPEAGGAHRAGVPGVGVPADSLVRNLDGRLLVAGLAPGPRPRGLAPHPHEQQDHHHGRGDEDQEGQEGHRGQHGAETWGEGAHAGGFAAAGDGLSSALGFLSLQRKAIRAEKAENTQKDQKCAPNPTPGVTLDSAHATSLLHIFVTTPSHVTVT